MVVGEGGRGAPKLDSVKQQYPGYEVKQFNIVIDVFEGWLNDLEETVRDLVEQRSRAVQCRVGCRK